MDTANVTELINGSEVLGVRPITKDDYGFLYQLLTERTPDINISHHRMPTWSEHCTYWDASPHLEARMIMLHDLPAGYYYLTKMYEIGIHLYGKVTGKGIGPEVIRYIINRHRGHKLYANVSPYNIRSQHMFERLGFRELQKVYYLSA